MAGENNFCLAQPCAALQRQADPPLRSGASGGCGATRAGEGGALFLGWLRASSARFGPVPFGTGGRLGRVFSAEDMGSSCLGRVFSGWVTVCGRLRRAAIVRAPGYFVRIIGATSESRRRSKENPRIARIDAKGGKGSAKPWKAKSRPGLHVWTELRGGSGAGDRDFQFSWGEV